MQDWLSIQCLFLQKSQEEDGLLKVLQIPVVPPFL